MYLKEEIARQTELQQYYNYQPSWLTFPLIFAFDKRDFLGHVDTFRIFYAKDNPRERTNSTKLVIEENKCFTHTANMCFQSLFCYDYSMNPAHQSVLLLCLSDSDADLVDVYAGGGWVTVPPWRHHLEEWGCRPAGGLLPSELQHQQIPDVFLGHQKKRMCLIGGNFLHSVRERDFHEIFRVNLFDRAVWLTYCH